MSCELECIGWGNTANDGVNLKWQSAACKDWSEWWSKEKAIYRRQTKSSTSIRSVFLTNM